MFQLVVFLPSSSQRIEVCAELIQSYLYYDKISFVKYNNLLLVIISNIVDSTFC